MKSLLLIATLAVSSLLLAACNDDKPSTPSNPPCVPGSMGCPK